jgi:hypothetical protein
MAVFFVSGFLVLTVRVSIFSHFVCFLQCFLFFYRMGHNDRGYGHWRSAGEFPVAQRQGECGCKTC